MISDGLQNHPYIKVEIVKEKVNIVLQKSKITRESELESAFQLQFIDERGKKTEKFNFIFTIDV